MPVAIAATKQTMADAYKNLAASPWFFACTGAPGTAAAPASETSGSGYARVQGTWASGSGGTLTCAQVLLTVGAITATHAGITTASSGGSQVDNADIPDTIFNNPGQLVLAPSFTVT